MELDFIGIVQEEVALEGLDGTTLSTLWIRLKENPQFAITLDDKSKPFLWRNIVLLEDVEFYELKEPRPPLVLFDRFDYIDPETGLILEMETVPEDIYPVKLIRDEDIRGSCFTYDTRKNITEEVRRGNNSVCLPLHQVIDRWGERLVIVASQQARWQSLMGTEFDPSYNWVDLTYCILERIGRGRYMGELSRGKLSLSVFNEAPKTLFYHTKKLAKQNVPIIRKQTVCSKDSQNRQVQCRIFHLTRFYKEIRSKYTVLREQLCDYLYQKPNHRQILSICRSELKIEEKSFKKLYQNACNYVKVYQTYYRNIYPNATPEEYMNKNKVTEKQLKIIELIKLPSKDVSDSDNEDEEDDEVDEVDNDEEKRNLKKYEIVYERPLLYQVIKVLEDSGPTGITLQYVKKIFSLDILESRLVVKYLVKMGVARMLMIDVGRQKKSIYISRKYEAESDFLQEVQQEKHKMKALTIAAEDVQNSAVSTVNLDQSTVSQEGETVVTVPLCDGDVLETKVEKTETVVDRNNESEKLEDIPSQCHVTGRFLKRANWIFEAVREAKLIDNAFVLVKMIRAKEKEEGIEFQVDKKSILRIVRKLVKERKIHMINTVIKVEEFEKQLSFVCDPTVQSTDQIVRSAIDQARHKLISVRREHIRDAKKGSLNTSVPKQYSNIPETAQQSIQRLQGYKSKLTASQMVFDRKAARGYGLLQKMMKIQMVHRYLWYLCYDYGKETVDSPDSTDQRLHIEVGVGTMQAADSAVTVTSNKTPELEGRTRRKSGTARQQSSRVSETQNALPVDWLVELQEPAIHVDRMNWKRYLTKLPEHKGFDAGWCLISDVLLSLPVEIFCQVITINYKIPGLKEILADPVRRFYPITHLPLFLTQQLLYARKYIFAFHDLCVRLCQMGLLSFGTQVMKEKDQMFIYIHKNASLIDTRTSLPAYCKTVAPPDENFIRVSYAFNSERDLDNYWIDLKLFSLNTFLNTKRQGQDVEEQSDDQDSSTVELTLELAMSPKDTSTVQDEGKIPGDGRGGAGIDSDMYCHLLRNWTQGTGSQKYPKKPVEFTLLPEPSGEEDNRRHEQFADRSFPEISAHQRLPRLMPKERLTLLGTKGKLPEVVKVTVQKNAKGNKGGKGVQRKSVERIVTKRVRRRKLKLPKCKKPKKIHPKLPWSDEKDKQILANQELMRVIWTPKEDSILLVCQVASLVMDKKRKGIVVPWTVVRDVMEEHCPNAKCPKTSKACQRRVRFALLNSQTRQNVSLFLEEALHDDDIAGRFRNKLIKFTDFEENHRDYIKLVKKLMQKFSSVDMSRNILPRNLSELRTAYNMTTVGQLHKVRRYSDVETKREICYNVLQNILHSYLSLEDKQGRSFEMYKLLSQYPDDLLLDVIKGMRLDGTVTKIKNDNRNTNIPTGTIMHDMKLTQRYDYIFRSRFPTSLFDDSQTFVTTLWQKLLESDKNEPFKILEQMEGGHCATLIAITQLRKIQYTVEIPEEIITLDAENMYLFPYGRGKVTLPMLLALQNKNPKENVQRSEENPKPEQIPGEKLPTFESPGTASPSKQASAQMPSTSSLAKAICPSSEIHFDTEMDQTVLEESSNSDSVERNRIKATHASRSLLCLLRTQSLGTKDLKAYNMQDNFVINMCPVSVTLKTDTEQDVGDWLFLDDGKINSVLEKLCMTLPFQLDLDKVWPDMKKSEGFTQRELNFAKHLYKNVESHTELGMKEYQLETLRKDSETYAKCLRALLKYSAIVKVGLTSTRFVAFCYARSWLTHSYKNTRGRSKQIDQEEDAINLMSNVETTQSKGENSEGCAGVEKISVQIPSEKVTTSPQKRKSSLMIADDSKTPIRSVNGRQKGQEVSETASQPKTRRYSSEADLEIECAPTSKKRKQKLSDESRNVTESSDSAKASTKRQTRTTKRKRSDSDIFVSSEEEKHETKEKKIEQDKPTDTDHVKKRSSTGPAPVSTYERVRFLSRPWRKPEGLINKPVLKMMLESVMLWIMSNPGSTIGDISKRYMPYLQPGMVNNILEILEDLGCVTKTFLRIDVKRSLFSKPQAVITVPLCRENDITVYDTTVEAVFRMGQFSSHVK